MQHPHKLFFRYILHASRQGCAYIATQRSCQAGTQEDTTSTRPAACGSPPDRFQMISSQASKPGKTELSNGCVSNLALTSSSLLFTKHEGCVPGHKVKGSQRGALCSHFDARTCTSASFSVAQCGGIGLGQCALILFGPCVCTYLRYARD